MLDLRTIVNHQRILRSLIKLILSKNAQKLLHLQKSSYVIEEIDGEIFNTDEEEKVINVKRLILLTDQMKKN